MELHPHLGRDELVAASVRAEPRDFAAAGFGCTRRIDRACRGPEICSRPRTGDTDRRVRREGPLPGGCDAYHLTHPGGFAWVDFSAGDRHRAVLWWESPAGGMLWVDGVRVGADHTLDGCGRWLDDRFYAVQAAGPDDHPAQSYAMGTLVHQIRSLLVYDAAHARTHLFEPGPAERWTDPIVVRDGDTLLLRPRRDAAPARTLHLR
ncbi:hypothetical protein [Actinoplanes rectilineatus]|uniref:hypothetical protein n=1 Tax=Actinoplanes rectilineatus TaxID=113571 RepID=UPI0006977E28|nr:hypothetical protein [Actinoplanes rectilineatus]